MVVNNEYNRMGELREFSTREMHFYHNTRNCISRTDRHQIDVECDFVFWEEDTDHCSHTALYNVNNINVQVYSDILIDMMRDDIRWILWNAGVNSSKLVAFFILKEINNFTKCYK